MDEQELSESGDPIFRYPNLTDELIPDLGNSTNIKAISAHIERHIGNIDSVLHEVLSDLVHIDVHWVKPSERFPFHTFVTSGMSDLPMNAPKGFEGHQYAELVVLLPATWPIDDKPFQLMDRVFKDEENYWPIRCLKMIARFPHKYKSWLCKGHSIPNGEEAAPFADNTKFGCILLLPNISLPKEFHQLTISNEKTIRFYGLYPIYKEEMELKLKKGLNTLLDNFEQYHISDVVDITRTNTCAKKKFFWLF